MRALHASMLTVNITHIDTIYSKIKTLLVSQHTTLSDSAAVNVYNNAPSHTLDISDKYHYLSSQTNTIIINNKRYSISSSIGTSATTIATAAVAAAAAAIAAIINGISLLVGQSYIDETVKITLGGLGSVLLILEIPPSLSVPVPPSCCVATICNVNPQTVNFDNQHIITNNSGSHLVSAVSNFYSAASKGLLRPNAPPLFPSYQQMMKWKQRQNHR